MDGLHILLAIIGIFSILILYSGCEENNRWNQFSQQHKCQKIGEMTAGYKTVGKTGYRCDDGLEYWR